MALPQDNMKQYQGDRLGTSTCINAIVNCFLTLSMDRKNSGANYWYYYGGDIRAGNDVITMAAGALILPDGINYIEVNDAGTISYNAVGFTDGRLPVAVVTVTAGQIVTYVDKRAWLAWFNGEGYLKLDQTTPQSVINGSPIFDGLEFDPTPTSTQAPYRMTWDSTYGTINVGLNSDVNMAIGQEMPVQTYNDTGVTIADGIPVYVSGRHGHIAKIAPARSDSESTSCILGLTTCEHGTIGDAKNGYTTTFGIVNKIKTDYTGTGDWGTTWAVGDKLYVSKTVAGQLTNVEPSAPHHADVIGTVAIVGAVGTGAIFVNINRHKQLEELSDCDGTALTTTGQIPMWNQTAGYFDFDWNVKDIPNITSEPSGFASPADVVVNYDSTTRKVTLTGTVTAYWKGVIIPALVSGWESAAHDATNGVWFLYYDGSNFVWSLNTPWTFEKVQIAFVNYGTSDKFAIRETHGVMQWQTHNELHNTIGTYKKSGGTISGYTLASTTPAERRPNVSAVVIVDEDLQTTNAELTSEVYTTSWLTGTVTNNFSIDYAEIVSVSGSQPYYNQYTGGAWLQTLMANNSYMSVWLIAIPTCAGTTCQKYRYVWIQGQKNDIGLTVIQAEKSYELNLGNLRQLAPEFTFLARFIIRYTGGNWQIVQVDTLTGVNFNQTSSPAGQYVTGPAGPDKSIQFNNFGVFGGESALSWDYTNKHLGIGLDAPVTQFHMAKEATGCQLMLETNYASNTGNQVIFRKSRGTIATPTATASGDLIMNLSARGHNGTNFSTSSDAYINLVAAEGFTGSAKGTYITFGVTPVGTTTLAEKIRINPNGNLLIGNTTDGWKLRVAPTANTTAGQTAFIQDATATTGSTKVVIKSGAGQSTGNLQEWQNISAAVMGSISESELITPATLKIKNSAKINSFTNSGSQADGTLAYTLPSAYPASNGYVLSCTTTGVTSWIAPGGGGGTPAGSDREVQWNNSGAFGASSKFVFSASDELRVGTLSAGVFTGSEMLTTSAFRVSADNGYGAQISTTISIGAQAAGNHVIALPIPSTAPATGYVLKLASVYDDGYGNYNLQTEWGAGGGVSPIVEDASPSFALRRLNESTTGNTRGQYAIDLQYKKADASQIALGVHSAILSGKNNKVVINYSTICGGEANLINTGGSVGYHVISGGYNNTIIGDNDVICGGYQNTNEGSYSFLGGGIFNVVKNICSAIVGGENIVCFNKYGFVGCGYGLDNQGNYSAIVGGDRNTISSAYSFLGGGYKNKIYTLANYGTVCGGYLNTINGEYAFIGGGDSNNISTGGTGYSVICGGSSNLSGNGTACFVGGGYQNRATGMYNLVIGGYQNTIPGDNLSEYNCIVGGKTNSIANNADYCFIGGGRANTINGSGSYSTIPGGYLNSANAGYSFACGYNAHADLANTFVFSDGTSATPARTNEFLIRATYGLTLINNAGTFDWYDDGAGKWLSSPNGASYWGSDGNWYTPSSREIKTNFNPADTKEILNKVSSVHLEEWEYKEHEGTKHIGIMAQDFNELFGYGNTPESVNSLDICGVLWAAVQELKKELDILKDYIKMQ